MPSSPTWATGVNPSALAALNIRAPHLIGTGDLHISKQIRINPVLGVLFAGVGAFANRLQPHDLH